MSLNRVTLVVVPFFPEWSLRIRSRNIDHCMRRHGLRLVRQRQADVPLRMSDYDVNFWREKADETYGCDECNGEAERRHAQWDIVGRTVVDGDERQPHNTGRVHRQTNVTRLVERLGNFSRHHLCVFIEARGRFIEYTHANRPISCRPKICWFF